MTALRRVTPAGQSWLAGGVGALLAVLLLVPWLAGTPFDDPGEGQHAQIAYEVAADHDWVTLHLNGVRYFDKPPLLYWLTAVSFRVFGMNEWAARLPPLLGAALAAAATAVLGARLLGLAGGLIAGGALLSCALFLVFGCYLRPETLFVAAIQWGFTGLVLGRRAAPSRASGWALVGGAALGVASLAKDPLGLVGPLVALAVALTLAGRARPVSAWLPWGAVTLLLAVGLGWYVAATFRNLGFLWYTVVDNHLLNALRLRQFPDEDVPLSSLEFLVVSVKGAFPWVVSAGVAMVSLARRRAWRDASETPWVALALWAMGLFVFFTALPFKLPHYALPAYPAIALLAVRAWIDHGERPRALIATHALLLGLVAAVFALAAFSDGRQFTALVFSATDVYTRKEAAWGDVGPLPPWSTLRPLIVHALLICLATAAALVVALVRGSGRLALVALTVGTLALMPSVQTGRSLVASRRAVAGLAARIEREMGTGDVLVHEGPIENSGSLEFYSGRRPALLDGHKSVLGIGATYPDASGIFWDTERFRREWLSGDRRLFLVTPRSPATSVVASLPAGSTRLLVQDNGRWLYVNRPAANPPSASLPTPSPSRN